METIFNNETTKISIDDTYIRITHEKDDKAIQIQYEIYSLIEKLSQILNLNENENNETNI